MNFEYDINKSNTNLKKHGICFEKIKLLWQSTYVTAQAKTKGEDRYLIVGKVKRVHYSCIYTLRKGNIRIISARRSSKKEVRFYHEHI